MKKIKILIMGAAGRDFHNFNVFFRNNSLFEVVAFTADQIPGIEDKVYPPILSGQRYPDGIPIFPESALVELIREHQIDQVVFAYSDISHENIMHKASSVLAAGADFWLLGPQRTMLTSTSKVLSVCATRTGCGKSQTTRRIMQILQSRNCRVVAVRHAMPYGNLQKQVVQRFASTQDFKTHNCTIEEMEEYEPYIEMNGVVYAGVDYQAILKQAEQEADFILWDGGNNDFSFYRPDLEIVVTDPLRPGHETRYHPGETNLKRAHAVVINKMDTANYEDIQRVRDAILENNPSAQIIEAASPIFVGDPDRVSHQRVLVIEDGPTLTHGGMSFGAGMIAAQRYGAREIVDPRPHAVGSLKKTFLKFPHIGPVLPAMGYGEEQMRDLEKTIQAVDCDLVLIGTPVDLRRIINFDTPTARVRYELQEIGLPNLETVIDRFLDNIQP